MFDSFTVYQIFFCRIQSNSIELVRSNRTRKNIEILKKFGSREAMFNSVRFDRTNSIEFDSVRFDSVRFGSISRESSRVSLQLFQYQIVIIVWADVSKQYFDTSGDFLVVYAVIANIILFTAAGSDILIYYSFNKLYRKALHKKA